jgi:pimeloyl-ACP methyl ester carboxylesterase
MRARRLIFRALLAVLGIYVGVCGFLLIAQNRLLYIGTVLPPHPPGLALLAFNGVNNVQIGWLAEPAGPVRGTVVYFHGNDEQAWQADQSYGPYFTARGWRVIFPEYRGFDFRRAEKPTHDNVIADAVAVMRLTHQRYPGPLWVAGNSLGAGIAAQAAVPGGAKRVLLFVPWDSMGAVAQWRYPFVPAKLLLRLDGTEYDSCAALSGIDAPVFITYAGQDNIIPAPHAQNLARCLDVSGSRLFALKTAGHLDWYKQLSPGQWDHMLIP